MDNLPEMFVRLEYKDDNSYFVVGQNTSKIDSIEILHDNISLSVAEEFIDLMEKKYPEHTSKPPRSLIKQEFKFFLERKNL